MKFSEKCATQRVGGYQITTDGWRAAGNFSFGRLPRKVFAHDRDGL
jgi:hypothetical protein